MPRAVVLAGFAEALSAPEAAWSLVDADFEVIVYARRGRRSAARHSRLISVREITAPEQSFDDAVRDLQEAMGRIEAEYKHLPKVLLPLDDASVLLSAAVRPEDSEWKLAGPQQRHAELALDKFQQIELARRAGFQVPDSWPIENDALPTEFPVILKAGMSCCVKDGKVRKSPMWICSDAGEFRNAMRNRDRETLLLAQQFVGGVGEGLFGIATGDGVRAWSAHRRLRMMNPQGSGSSACVSQPVDPTIREKAEKFLSLSGWRGLFMIELLKDAGGDVWFIELNGRPWGSTALSRRQRLEYPAWQVWLALEKTSPEQVPFPIPGIVCRNLGRELMHLLFLLRGPRSRAFNRWPSFWKAAREILRLRRREYLYNWRRGDPLVFFADCIYTVMDNVLKARG